MLSVSVWFAVGFAVCRTQNLPNLVKRGSEMEHSRREKLLKSGVDRGYFL